MQNGLNLGYEAVFDLSRHYWKPIAAPRFRDGTPLVHGDIWPIFVTETTLHGLALGESVDKDYLFAWRADTGFVRKIDNKKTYEQLVAEAGDANFGIDIDAIGTGLLLDELPKRPEFAGHKCKTKLTTW